MATPPTASSSLYSLLKPSNRGACAPNAAFVTLVANESYVQGALCLKRTLQRLSSACPIVLVVADGLAPTAMVELQGEFKDVRALSALRQRLDRYEQRALSRSGGRRLEEERDASAGVTPSGVIKSTRQLGRAGGWARRTHQKLLLFALKGYRKAAFLDLDMLIVRNIDAILEQPAFSAVAALPYTRTSFNSGVFVFEPSLATAAALDDLSQRATFKPVRKSADGSSSSAGMVRIRGYGERFALSDQSILNHHYRATWNQLPYGYNLGVKVRQVAPKLWGKVELAVVHFVHRPKPWEPSLSDATSPMSQLTRKLGIDALTRAWRWRCGVGARGNGTTEEERLLFGWT